MNESALYPIRQMVKFGRVIYHPNNAVIAAERSRVLVRFAALCTLYIKGKQVLIPFG